MYSVNVVSMRRGIARAVLLSRTQAGMTQAQLAQECGLHKKTISEVEDRGTLSVETLVALAHGLDITLDDLVPVTIEGDELL